MTPWRGPTRRCRRCRRRCGGWSAAARRRPRWSSRRCKALDAALNALDEARGHLEHALRVADHDPHELERIEERLFALRAAGRKYNSPVDALNALAEKYAGDLALIDAGAERLAALEKAAKEARRAIRQSRRRAVGGAHRRRPRSSTRRSTAN